MQMSGVVGVRSWGASICLGREADKDGSCNHSGFLLYWSEDHDIQQGKWCVLQSQGVGGLSSGMITCKLIPTRPAPKSTLQKLDEVRVILAALSVPPPTKRPEEKSDPRKKNTWEPTINLESLYYTRYTPTQTMPAMP